MTNKNVEVIHSIVGHRFQLPGPGQHGVMVNEVVFVAFVLQKLQNGGVFCYYNPYYQGKHSKLQYCHQYGYQKGQSRIHGHDEAP